MTSKKERRRQAKLAKNSVVETAPVIKSLGKVASEPIVESEAKTSVIKKLGVVDTPKLEVEKPATGVVRTLEDLKHVEVKETAEGNVILVNDKPKIPKGFYTGTISSIITNNEGKILKVIISTIVPGHQSEFYTVVCYPRSFGDIDQTQLKKNMRVEFTYSMFTDRYKDAPSKLCVGAIKILGKPDTAIQSILNGYKVSDKNIQTLTEAEMITLLSTLPEDSPPPANYLGFHKDRYVFLPQPQEVGATA